MHPFTRLAALALIAPTLAHAQAPATPLIKPPPESLVDRDRLLQHIKDLPTKRAAWSTEEHTAGLRATEAQITAKLTALGFTPLLDPIDFLGARTRDDAPSDHAHDPKVPWNNISIDLSGTTATHEIILLGAHFDAVPVSPGADDNGTGVACLLEAARVLKDHPTQRTIRLVFFNLEEVGLVGSRAYAQRLKAQTDNAPHDAPDRIVAMISLDMLGFYSDKPNSQKSPIEKSRFFTPPTVADFLGVAGILKHRVFSQALTRAMHASDPAFKSVVVDFLPVAPRDLLRSDHAPFLALGIPAVLISDTANFRSPHYHKPSDTIDTLDSERFTISCRAIIGGVHRLAGLIGEPLPVLAPPATAVPAKSEPAAAPTP